MEEINEGHYHEIMDRVHVINSMIYSFLIDHPGMTKLMNRDCRYAQTLLSNVANMAGEKLCSEEPTPQYENPAPGKWHKIKK